MNKNCPNCAAPYDVSLNKCPYCGTSYYDLSALDFSTNEPFYLKIKTKINGEVLYVTQLVTLGTDISINFECNDVYYYKARDNTVLGKFKQAPTVITNLSFVAVPNEKNTLFLVEKVEEIGSD